MALHAENRSSETSTRSAADVILDEVRRRQELDKAVAETRREIEQKELLLHTIGETSPSDDARRQGKNSVIDKFAPIAAGVAMCTLYVGVIVVTIAYGKGAGAGAAAAMEAVKEMPFLEKAKLLFWK